jgi:heme A synthase
MRLTFVDRLKSVNAKMLGLSFISLGLIYSVMLFGVYIAASHQGLSCKGWPLCPNGVSFPPEKYFFEHFHRMFAIITSAIVIVTAIYAVKKVRAARKLSIVSVIIIIIQIILGMFVVDSKLEPLLVAAHLLTGLLLFATMLTTFLITYRLKAR